MKNIKLIATDLDGCLMDADGKLPPNFDEAYDLMKKNNVIFAGASGRSISGLMRPFGDKAKDMTFISDNGARIFHKGEMLFEKALEKEDFIPMLKEMRSHKGLLPLACGQEHIWLEDESAVTKEMDMEISKYFPVRKECRFEDIPEKVIKFAILYFDDIEKNIYPFFKRFDNDRICVCVSAFVWIDIYLKEVSKGTGVKVIQDKFGIKPEETVVFGDYLNDISLADHALYSYAPANAHEKVRERFYKTIEPNTQYGVTNKIIRLMKGD